MKDDAIRAVPERVREQVRRALAALTRWNQAVMDVRNKPRHDFRYIYGEVTRSDPVDCSHPLCPSSARP
jgi:hypothetical protein